MLRWYLFLDLLKMIFSLTSPSWKSMITSQMLIYVFSLWPQHYDFSVWPQQNMPSPKDSTMEVWLLPHGSKSPLHAHSCKHIMEFSRTPSKSLTSMHQSSVLLRSNTRWKFGHHVGNKHYLQSNKHYLQLHFHVYRSKGNLVIISIFYKETNYVPRVCNSFLKDLYRGDGNLLPCHTKELKHTP